ncbi:POT family-domain-containing protein [Blastocladiella britannica]|nr:POT family-domain-containing protein [Blastocladiella britannica]
MNNSNEFAERFTFYGIKGLINRYYQFSGASKETAKTLTHVFNMVTYFCPLIGAAISDSFLGKYKTIVWLSLVYLIGNAALVFTAIPAFRSVASISVALYLISLGTGGIKPCVAPHGGDQYLRAQANGMRQFFGWFYIAINLGAFLSGYIVPAIQNGFSCFGDYLEAGDPSTGVCYFAAYIVPTVVFAIALSIFIYGHRYYRIVPPTGKFVPGQMVLVIGDAISGYVSGQRAEAGDSFFSINSARYGKQFAEETAEFLRMFLQILPISFVWMVYDQQSTEWQNQYDRMNYYFGSLKVTPEQWTNIVNPVMVVTILWVLVNWIYPAIERTGVRVTPLRRMALGSVLVTLSFLVSGFLQGPVISNFNGKLTKDGLQDPSPEGCSTCIHGAWQLPQWFLASLGECMFSPTGNEFSYTQVGKNMKSISSSFWLLLVAIGNFIVVAFEEAQGSQPWALDADGNSTAAKYYVYTAICAGANLWFIIGAYFYRYKPDAAHQHK